MLNGSATLVVGSARLGSARLGSARLGSAWLGLAWLGSAYSAVFSVRQVLIHIIYNKPATEAGRIMPWLRFFAFTGKAVV